MKINGNFSMFVLFTYLQIFDIIILRVFFAISPFYLVTPGLSDYYVYSSQGKGGPDSIEKWLEGIDPTNDTRNNDTTGATNNPDGISDPSNDMPTESDNMDTSVDQDDNNIDMGTKQGANNMDIDDNGSEGNVSGNESENGNKDNSEN